MSDHSEPSRGPTPEAAAYPRILVISDEGPQTGSAGGILLHRLLAGHPPERLRVVAREVPALGEPLPGVVYQHLATPWTRLERSRLHRLKRSLRAFGLVPAVRPEEVDRLVGGFSPDVVLCVMQHAAYYDTAWQYARRMAVPLIAVVHDVNDDFEPVLPWARSAAARRDGRFYRAAARRLCVSPEMSAYLEQRYGANGETLYPSRGPDLEARPFADSLVLRSVGTLTLGFAGNLGYGYGDEIQRLLPTLREAGAKVILYTRPPPGPLSALADSPDVCEWRGFVPSLEAWAGIKRDCDAVWLPYPQPAGRMERLFRYHFPSKLPEYLALGLPVVVTGPEFATGARWALAHPSAAVHHNAADRTALAALLRQLRDDPARRASLAAGASAAGESEFAPEKIVAAFYRSIRSALGGKAPPP